MDKAQILIASNRGPVSFSTADDGSLEHRRGGGGLVSGMISVASEIDSLWVCSALSDADRRAAAEAPGARLDSAHDLDGMRVHMLDIPETTFAGAYTGVANSTLWFVQHMLYDTPNKPSFGSEFRRLWEDYTAYNNAFAEAIVGGAAENARVAVQDYHLALVPRILRARRPDLRIAHFSHTPWAPPEYFRMLPARVARELLEGMLGADRLGFLTRRWADAFEACGERFAGGLGGTRVGVHGLGADADFLRARAHQADVAERMAVLRDEMAKGPFTGVLHCYSSGRKLAETGIALGFQISFSGSGSVRKTWEVARMPRTASRPRPRPQQSFSPIMIPSSAQRFSACTSNRLVLPICRPSFVSIAKNGASNDIILAVRSRIQLSSAASDIG